MSLTEKIDVLDLIIFVLKEHEESMSSNIRELSYLLDTYVDIMETQSLLLQAVIERLCNQNTD
jgi:capsular polysaccharide biosynthesis protein